jgi:hypothetical protein
LKRVYKVAKWWKMNALVYLFGKICVISKILYFNWSTVSLDLTRKRGNCLFCHLMSIE